MAVPGQLGAPRLSTTPWRPLPCATAGSRSGCHCRWVAAGCVGRQGAAEGRHMPLVLDLEPLCLYRL